MNLKDLYTLAYIGGGNLAKKEAAAGNMISRRLFQAALNLKKQGTPQARRAFEDALAHNKKVVDRFYRMHTNFNKDAYNSLLNSYDPRTLRLPSNRTYPLATPRVTPPENLHRFLGDDAYKAVLAQHAAADDLFRASNRYLANSYHRPYFTSNLDEYLTKNPISVPSTNPLTDETMPLLRKMDPEMGAMKLPASLSSDPLTTAKKVALPGYKRAVRPDLPGPAGSPGLPGPSLRRTMKRWLKSLGL